MEKILRVKFPFKFDILYLGKGIERTANSGDKYIFRIMSIAITRKWLKTKAPQREDWVDVMHNIYMMERLTFSVRIETGKFKNFWKTGQNLYHHSDQTLLSNIVSYKPLGSSYRLYIVRLVI